MSVNINEQTMLFRTLTFQGVSNSTKCAFIQNLLKQLPFKEEVNKYKKQLNANIWYVPTDNCYQYVIGIVEYENKTKKVPVIVDKEFYLNWLRPYKYKINVKTTPSGYYKIKIIHETYRPGKSTELSHMVAVYHKLNGYLNLYRDDLDERYVVDHITHNTSINCKAFLRVITQSENIAENKRKKFNFVDSKSVAIKNKLFDTNGHVFFEIYQKYPYEMSLISAAIQRKKLFLHNDNIIVRCDGDWDRNEMLNLVGIINRISTTKSTTYNPYDDFSETYMYFILYILGIIDTKMLTTLQKEYFWYRKTDTYVLYDMPNSEHTAVNEYNGYKALTVANVV